MGNNVTETFQKADYYVVARLLCCWSCYGVIVACNEP